MQSGMESSSPLLSFPSLLPFDFIKGVTEDFAEERKIGQGGFGVVYKGVLANGGVIAVKRFRDVSTIYDKQFENEVGSLLQISHKNIVKLLGYCYESRKKVVEHRGRYIIAEEVEKLLCYEYMPKGSLDKHLFDERCRLDWHMRYKIIRGICDGLHFLHEGLERPIIHMDLKPENILLDDNMVPKIADFGFSRLFGQEQTRTCTQNVIGSIGYMAPEYIYRGEVSMQSDVYSFGVLLLEIVTGEKNYPNKHDMTAKNFIENVRQNWTKMSDIVSKYPSLGVDCYKQIKRCIDIGLNCVQTNRKDRPSVREITRKLN